jgi:hypothetical protein
MAIADQFYMRDKFEDTKGIIGNRNSKKDRH